MNDAPRPPTLPHYGRPITLAEAKRVMAAAEAEAEAQGWAMTIAILDCGGHVVMQHKMDDANLGSVPLSRRKAETAVRFRRPSKVYEDLVVAGGPHLRLLATADEVVPLEGGIPLVADGRIVGAIGVSGMASHEDGRVAAAGASAL